MKYIYKHGNQYWYQRAIPEKLIKILGKKTLKIPLKTNKISTAVKRATLQALEHKKMFSKLKNQSKLYFKKIFSNKLVDTSSFTIDFNEDFEDTVKNLLFNKHQLLDLIDNASSDKIKNENLKNILAYDDNNSPVLSELIEDYVRLKNIFEDTKKINSIKKSISLMVNICGDKPLVHYSKIDAEKFRNYFTKLNKISTGKRNQSNLQNLFETMFNNYSLDKRNPFSGLKWPDYKKAFKRESLSPDELEKVKKFCLASDDLINIIFGLIIDTGCSFSEIAGLKTEDLNLDRYNPYIIIRSNSLRQIKNFYKKRIIPLVGVSFKTAKKIKKGSIKESLFSKYEDEGFDNLFSLEQKMNSLFKKITNGKTSISLRYTLIERLKNVGCPEKIIYELIGLANKDTLYKENISLNIKHSWMSHIIN